MVGTETENLSQWSGWRPKTHSHCRKNCEKLVSIEGWRKLSFYFTIGGYMEEQKSFKERVKDTIIQNAQTYKDCYLDYEYLLCSSAFSKRPYYIISAHEDNYLHLTGVHTELGAKEFFEKSSLGILEEEDFDFIKINQTEGEVKGSVRRKMQVLPKMMEIFTTDAQVEEDFVKNRIRCSFAIEGMDVTLGLSMSERTKPKTLLKGNGLDTNKKAPIDLIIRKHRTDQKFDTVLTGDSSSLERYRIHIKDIVDERLFVQ